VRVSDAAPPTIPAHAIPPAQPSATWKAKPIIGLEYLPLADLWDDADPAVTWDALGEPYVWDAPGTASGFTDVWCDTAGVEIVHGEPDEHDLYPPSSLTLTLYDPTGKYRRRTADGRLVFYAAGRRLVALAQIGAGSWWLFAGTIATWHEQADGFIEVVAYSGSATLAQDPGRDWTAGTAGQQLPPRVAAILAAATSTQATRVDSGLATFVVPVADRVPPLEVLQRAAWSDGGLVYSDADDTLTVRDRNWRDGRNDSPAPPLVLTDNLCDRGAVVLAEVELADNDDWLAARVILSTEAGLVAVASNPAELIDPRLIYTHPDTDIWDTQSVGDSLAAHIANVRGAQRPALELGRVYLHDRRHDYWQAVIDTRLGDRITWTHQDRNLDGTLTVYELPAVLSTIRHLLTAETWIVELATTPAVGAIAVESWDVTAYTWDDAAAAAVWR
jgi:hypothetical protein